MARQATFKDWKDTGGMQAQWKDMIDAATKVKKKKMLLSLIPWIGPFVWGWQGIICMDYLQILKEKEPKSISLYRLFIRFNTLFIALILEKIYTSDINKVIKVMGIEKYRDLLV